MEILSATHSTYSVAPGKTAPQGATFVDKHLQSTPCPHSEGVNFAVYAPEATQLTLSLFHDDAREDQLKMHPSREGIWHIYVDGIKTGQLYAFRADGHWSANVSPRFNRHKLLLDPYAREVMGKVQWCEQLFDYTLINNQWTFNQQDSAPFMPRCVVRDTEFDWQGVVKPRIPDQKSVIYETHPKGFTFTHPGIPEHIRGTYLGMCHPVIISHLKKLGITTVELMPVTSRVSEQRLIDLALKNYWGYNPLCMMAPEPSYSVEDPVTEMKTMVRELHRAGIEVILDVVFNHTCEGGHGGPFMSFRGLAESEYYHMNNHNGELSSVNYSGCGNTMNFDSPQTLKLTIDSLRNWVEEYQVDGFRFDLAPTMARQHRTFSKHSPFFKAVSQDSVLSQIKLIAEPWDIGPDGYHLTDFPNNWQSWNDCYRDACRKFWKGEQGIQTEMALRFSGSEDLFKEQSYLGTVNYICSHDGFSLMDLVSYEQRRNYANGEDNRDGDQHNHSWNNGYEGETDSPKVCEARLRARKNLIGMLMLSKGTPMLLAGDEFSNQQQGNNNAYCQDSEISWMDWSWMDNPVDGDGARMLDFTSQIINFRCNHPLLTDESNNTVYELYSQTGIQVEPDYFTWHHCEGFTAKIRSKDDSVDEILIVLVNSGNHHVKVQFPAGEYADKRWFIIIDTDKDQSFCKEPLLNNGWYEVSPKSVVLIEEVS